MSEFSQISRLQEENRKALLERQQRLLTCEKFKQDYEKLEELLKTLPLKTSHEVMVPIGSVAFMPGKLVHTNEITVLLGDNWFAERSASQAVEIVARRKKYLESSKAGINEDIKSFEERLKFAEDIQSLAEEKSDVKEIKEELSQQDEERLSNRGARKAHPKAKRLGGSKKVEGLRGNIKGPIKGPITRKDKEAQPLSSEDLSLFARLEELEEKETANAELDQIGKDDSDDNSRTEIGFVKENDDVRWEQSLTAKDKDITKRKVRWEASVTNKGSKKTDGLDSDDDDDNEDGDDVKTTIDVKFSSSSTSQQQIPELCSDQPAIITPADIYSQFTPPKQELKSILKKPSIDEKNKQTSEDKAISTTQQAVHVSDVTETEEQTFDSQKAFTGTIVEKPVTQSEQQDFSVPQINTSQPEKKPSRFKAARQKHQ